jgi:hypothetical protein
MLVFTFVSVIYSSHPFFTKAKLAHPLTVSRFHVFDIVEVNGRRVNDLEHPYIIEERVLRELWRTLGGLEQDLEWPFYHLVDGHILRVSFVSKWPLPTLDRPFLEFVELLPASVTSAFDVMPRRLSGFTVDPDEELLHFLEFWTS